MLVHKLSNSLNIKDYLQKLGTDSGGIKILSQKADLHLIEIKNLAVGGANILKQDALSIGADLAVPKGTVIAKDPYVKCLLIANTKQLHNLSKKELAQPFGLNNLAKKLQNILKTKRLTNVKVMGIINVNNDSFFSNSRFNSDDAIEKIKSMIDDAASIIDIGAVSSAPNSKQISVKDELKRVRPILDLIKKEKLFNKVDFSIDSYQPEIITYALESGIKIVNDITGLKDDNVCKVCTKYGAKVIIMHMQGSPRNMQKNPFYEDILTDIYSFFEHRIVKAQSFGIRDIILDVGIGFGKTLEHNLTLIKHLQHFTTLDKPLLIGASRKSMIDKISPSETSDRLPGTLALHLEAINNGASILRVHDVKEHIQALKVVKALKI